MICGNHFPSLVLCAFAQMLAHAMREKMWELPFFQLILFATALAEVCVSSCCCVDHYCMFDNLLQILFSYSVQLVLLQ